MEKNSVFVGRRDQPKSSGMGRDEFVANASSILAEMQQGLFDRALQLRKDNTVDIDNEADFRAFFTPKNADTPEIHGGFANCYFADEESIDALLKELKVTIRCIPRDNNDTPGTCFATGKPAEKKGIFAKAY